LPLRRPLPARDRRLFGEHLDDATVALAEVAQACNDAGLAMEVSPLAAGPTWRVRMATRVTPTRTSR
jgi:hypothetical protein